MRDRSLRFLHDHRAARTEALADRLADQIEAENPGYADNGLVTREDLRGSVRNNITRVLELLAETLTQGDLTVWPPGADTSYDAARATGELRAQQGVPLDDVLRSFRLGGRMIWEDLVDRAEAALGAEELREVGTGLWQVVDATSAQVAASYHAHERATLRVDEQRRAQLWEGLLNGRAREPGYANQAAQLLNLPVMGDYVVVTGRDLDIDASCAAAAPHASAWVERADGAVGLIAVGKDGPEDLRNRLQALAQRGGVGASGVVHGLAGVDQGLAQASLALRGLASEAGLAVFDQRLPEALLISAPEVARRLIEVWVTPLFAAGATEADVLIFTARAWIDGGGSPTRTATRVHCHRNTVLNRIRRIEQLLGADFAQNPLPIELDLALRAYQLQTS